MKFIDVIKIQDGTKKIHVYDDLGTSVTADKEEWLKNEKLADRPVDKVKDRVTDNVVEVKVRA